MAHEQRNDVEGPAKSLEKVDKTPQAAARTSAYQSAASLPRNAGGLAGAQAAAGNLAVQRLFNDGSIQAKLSVSPRDDPHEKQADQVADQVMRMPEPQLSRVCDSDGSRARFQTDHLGQGRDRLQAKHAGATGLRVIAAPGAVHQALNTSGQPLGSDTRRFFEPRLGVDLDNVRIHTDRDAANAARSISARAFTAGPNVVFAQGQYQPDNESGRRLIGHELTHVLQQSGNGGSSVVDGRVQRSPDGDPDATKSDVAAGDNGLNTCEDLSQGESADAVCRMQPPHPPGGDEGARLLAQYPRLAAALTVDQWVQLAAAAEARARNLGQHLSSAGQSQVSFTLPLTALLDQPSRFVDVDPWDAVFALFKAQDQSVAAGVLIRNEIARRWFQRHGIDPTTETVDVSLFDPYGMIEASPTQLDFNWRGMEVFGNWGGLGIESLERASPGISLQVIIAEVRLDAQHVGEAVALNLQADDFDLRVPGFLYCAPQDFSKLAIGKIAAYLQAITKARNQLEVIATLAPASSFVAGLDARMASYLDPLNDLYVKAHEWKNANPADLTLADEVTRKIAEKQHGWVDPAKKKMYVEMFGEEKEQEIADLYHHDKISLEDARDLETSYRRRKIIVELVTMALTVATAGFGDLVVGGFMVTEEVAGMGLVSIELPAVEAGLEFKMAAGGLQAATTTVGNMATEHLITAQTNFDNPVAQAYWRSGSTYTAGQYARAASLSFVMGAGSVAAVEGAARFFQAVRGLLRNSGAPAPEPQSAPQGWGEPAPTSTELVPAEAPASEPALTVLSEMTDPVRNVRAWQLQSADGELVTMSVNMETGNGYLIRFKTGETLQISNGEIGGPLKMLDAGSAFEATDPSAVAIQQDVPAPMLTAGAPDPVAIGGGGGAGEAALRQELELAFRDIGRTISVADQQALVEALNLIDQLPPGPEKDLVLGSHAIVGQGLGTPAGHVEVAMRLVAEAQREGLSLQQLLDQQRAAWQQIEPQLEAGQWQGLGVNVADPRAVYSRSMIRIDQQSGRAIDIVPRDQSYGDRGFFENVASQRSTLYDMGIDLGHGWHGHAMQDLVATEALMRGGAPIDSPTFRQALGAIQTIGQANAQYPARQAMIGQLIWQAHYDSYSRPEFITAVLRRVLGYID
jgi:hypothetical protein